MSTGQLDHAGPGSAKRRPLLALVAAAALWGVGVTGTKYALGGFGPATLLSVELCAATAALWAVLLVQGYRPPRSWRVACVLGLLEPSVAYLTDTFGLSRTTATDGAVIGGLESATVILLAATLLGEAVSGAALLSSALALGGLAVLAGSGSAHGAGLGDLLVAGGVLSAGLYTVAAKRFDDGTDAVSVTAWQFAFATVVCSGVTLARWLTGAESVPVSVAPPFWLAAVVVGVVGFAVSFLLFNGAVSQVPAGSSAVVFNLMPVFGAASAIVFLGEGLSPAADLGAALIAISVVCFSVAERGSPEGRLRPQDG